MKISISLTRYLIQYRGQEDWETVSKHVVQLSEGYLSVKTQPKNKRHSRTNEYRRQLITMVILKPSFAALQTV